MTFDAVIPGGGREEEGLAARGMLRVYLDQAETPEARNGVSSWVEGHLGEPGKEVDSMAPVDFLKAAGRFMEQTGVASVYDVWFDNDVIYRAPESKEKEDNHNEALAKAESFSSSSKGHSREIGVWSHGMSGDFYLEFRLKYRRVHDAGAPPLILEVSGNPKELTDPTGENQFELDERLTQLESDKAELERANADIGGRFAVKLQELQGTLEQIFKVAKIEQSVKVDVASIW